MRLSDLRDYLDEISKDYTDEDPEVVVVGSMIGIIDNKSVKTVPEVVHELLEDQEYPEEKGGE